MARTFVGRIVLGACALLLLLAVEGLTPPSAQALDIQALEKQFLQEYQAGRYGEAAKLAERLIELAGKRLGKRHCHSNTLAWYGRAV